MIQLRLRWPDGGGQEAWVPRGYDLAQVHEALAAAFPGGHALVTPAGKPAFAGQARHFLAPRARVLTLRVLAAGPDEPGSRPGGVPGLARCRIAFEGEPVWAGRLPPGAEPRDVWRQLRAVRDLPPWDDCEVEGPPDEPDLRRARAPETVRPVLPSSVPLLAHWLVRLEARLALFGDVCPQCRRGLLDPDTGRCLGRVALRGAERHPLRCGYAAPANPAAPEFDDRTDRSRFNGGGGGGAYDPSEHIANVVACRTRRRLSDIPAHVFARVAEWHALDAAEPTPHSVFATLNRLNTHEPGRYSPYYRESARIAKILELYPTRRPYAFLHRPPPVGAPPAAMPYEVGTELVAMARVACAAWDDAPRAVRQGRVNFFRSDFTLWMLLGSLAAARDDDRLLHYRSLFANAHGERPALKCPVRDAEYVRQWAWICRRADWPFVL